MKTNPQNLRADFEPNTETVFHLARVGSWPKTRHRFERTSVLAVQTALAAERPLLITGEPGVGKSQLARAAAHVLNVPFLYHVVSARSEHTDLLYEYDAVSRLAQAQVLGRADAKRDWKAELKEERFIRPGVLWWAFDWEDARKQAKRSCRSAGCSAVAGCCPGCGQPAHPPEGTGDDQWQPSRGCVVLVDEIDKADTDVPNGLLESFGNLGFQVPGAESPVARQPDCSAPLLIITTNQERELPAAFVRRCLVLKMEMPGKTDEQKKQFLIGRGRDHCGAWITSDAVYREAAEQLFDDRRIAEQAHALVKPGIAEYLDLLYALSRLCPNDSVEQGKKLKELSEFVFRKTSGDVLW
jgi:MoxR-like ATPase